VDAPPLVDTYPSAVALALIGLCPFIVLSTATTLLQSESLKTLHTTTGSLQLSDALANAGYAFGAVLAAGLISRFRLRDLFPICEALFVVGCLICAFSSSVQPFIVGRTFEGLATGLLLVIALPPLLTRFGARRVPRSAAITNIGLFGAATVGPVVGGIVAAREGAEALQLAFAGLGLVGIVLSRLAISPELGAFRPNVRVLQVSVLLALGATLLPFLASSLLPKIAFVSVEFLVLTGIGVAALAILIVYEYRRPEPLMPVKLLSTTLPVGGMLTAMVAGAAFVAFDELVQTMFITARHASALRVGLLFWPQAVGVVVAAVLFAAIFRTRFVPVLALTGLGVLLAAGVVIETLGGARRGDNGTVLVAAALLGFGAGATVSPGLFLAGLAAPSRQVGPAFALVELLRSEATYIVAPIALDVATGGGSPPGALGSGLGNLGWALVATLGTTMICLVALFVGSGARLHTPDISNWADKGAEGLPSPPVAEPLRSGA
jgi:MFS family permease